jgi:transcriptional regulator with XRE-family HTH domain
MQNDVEKKLMKNFGSHIRQLRQQKQLSQEALALSSGLDRTYIGGVERGERNISLINIQRIADGLGVPTSELFPHGQ